jgi:hypothetical protein
MVAALSHALSKGEVIFIFITFIKIIQSSLNQTNKSLANSSGYEENIWAVALFVAVRLFGITILDSYLRYQCRNASSMPKMPKKIVIL